MSFISAVAFGIVFAILRFVDFDFDSLKMMYFSVFSCFLDSVVVSAAANSLEKIKMTIEIRRLLGWF